MARHQDDPEEAKSYWEGYSSPPIAPEASGSSYDGAPGTP